MVREGDAEHVFVREGEGRYRFAAVAAPALPSGLLDLEERPLLADLDQRLAVNPASLLGAELDYVDLSDSGVDGFVVADELEPSIHVMRLDLRDGIDAEARILRRRRGRCRSGRFVPEVDHRLARPQTDAR